MSDVLDLPFPEALAAVSPEEYAAASLNAIRAGESLNAFLHVADGPRGGRVPIAVKDNIVTTDMPTTCASRILDGFHSPFDAFAIERLRSWGGGILGKTNMDEFAMGSSSEHSAFGPVRNPWDPTRVPGGSSGGSAVAVAARMTPIALGSETGGSVREPAAFCGIVGVKPTYGRVSRRGLVAFGSGLDQIGIFSKTVGESADVLGVIAGHDPGDATSSREPVPDYRGAIEDGVRGMRVGVIPEALEGLAPPVRANFDDAVSVLAAAGASVREVKVSALRYAVAIYSIVANAEASANLSRFDGIRYGARRGEGGTLDEIYAATRGEGFGAEVKRRIMLGTFALSAGYYDAYYGRAQRVRQQLRSDFLEAFGNADVILTPTVAESAFEIGAKTADPLTMYLSDVFTAPANLVGIPAVAVPSGFDGRGLPLSLQIMAPHFQEQLMFRVARAYERETMFWTHKPSLRVSA